MGRVLFFWILGARFDAAWNVARSAELEDRQARLALPGTPKFPLSSCAGRACQASVNSSRAHAVRTGRGLFASSHILERLISRKNTVLHEIPSNIAPNSQTLGSGRSYQRIPFKSKNTTAEKTTATILPPVEVYEKFMRHRATVQCGWEHCYASAFSRAAVVEHCGRPDVHRPAE